MRPALLILLAAAGCATSTASRWEGELDEDLADRVAGESERCVSSMAAQGLTIAAPDTLVYRQGRTLWVNKLARNCPGFEPLATLIVETQGSQYCRGDRVRALEAGISIPGPTCLLGDFVPWRRPR